MEEESNLRKKTENDLNAVLISSPNGGIKLCQLAEEYRKYAHSEIPLEKLGFSSVEKYINSIPHCAKIEHSTNGVVVKGVSNEDNQHIAVLVSKQRNFNRPSETRHRPSLVYVPLNGFGRSGQGRQLTNGTMRENGNSQHEQHPTRSNGNSEDDQAIMGQPLSEYEDIENVKTSVTKLLEEYQHGIWEKEFFNYYERKYGKAPARLLGIIRTQMSDHVEVNDYGCNKSIVCLKRKLVVTCKSLGQEESNNAADKEPQGSQDHIHIAEVCTSDGENLNEDLVAQGCGICNGRRREDSSIAASKIQTNGEQSSEADIEEEDDAILSPKSGMLQRLVSLSIDNKEEEIEAAKVELPKDQYVDILVSAVNSLTRISANLLGHDFKAIDLKLVNLPDSDNPDHVKALSDLILWKECVALVVGRDSDYPLVELYDTTSDDGVNINEKIATQLDLQGSENFEQKLPRILKQCVASISHISDSGTFTVVVPGPGIKKLADMITELSNFYSKTAKAGDLVYTPEQGKIVGMRSKEDGRLYRVQITSVMPSERKVEIDFIDRGNREKVSNITLREIPDNLKELKSLPPQTVKCTLADCPEVAKDLWKSGLARRLTSELKTQTVVVKVVKEQTDNDVAVVEMFKADPLDSSKFSPIADDITRICSAMK